MHTYMLCAYLPHVRASLVHTHALYASVRRTCMRACARVHACIRKSMCGFQCALHACQHGSHPSKVRAAGLLTVCCYIPGSSALTSVHLRLRWARLLAADDNA